MTKAKQALCILGNQLFPDHHWQPFKGMPAFMAEDHELCTYFRFHQHKIILFLSAMRHMRKRLEKNGLHVTYHELDVSGQESYIDKLRRFLEVEKIRTLHVFEIEDKFMEERLQTLTDERQIELRVHPSPMFTCSREEFSAYLGSKKKPFMKTFYERQRRRLDILMEEGQPYGGRFSFDTENRRKLPKGHQVPPAYPYKLDSTDRDVMDLVGRTFADHPGEAENYWIPTTREAALAQFEDFLEQRMEGFGPFQDAICANEGFLHHSLISPAINLGLLTPDEIVTMTMARFAERSLPIESVEGFLRQVIGWREFVRGIYQHFSERMDQENYWGAQRQLTEHWYRGDTGLPPLDDTIQRAQRYGYSHHIERLMILANLMNLCEIEPRQVFRWFMEMYVDSSDWVMAANVYGMGLMSEGGIFATKPYISGSNYILKMSDYKKGPWCDIWDGLYWRFVEKHFDFFDRNPRMRMMTRTLGKMDPARRELIFGAAEEFLERVTCSEKN